MQRVLTRWFKWIIISLTVCSVFRPTATAQVTSQEDLRKEAQNPVASVIKLPFEQDTFFSTGVYNRIPAALQAQPIIPIQVSRDWLLVPRIVATPLAYQPDLTSKSGGTIGMGDTNPTLFLTPTHAEKVVWAVGPTVLIPTATNAALGLGKWGLGPSVVVLTQPSWGSVDLLIHNIWSFAGDPERASVNQMLLQYAISYDLPRGWYLTTQPSITADWTQSKNKRWVVPFGGGAGRTFNVGKRGLDANAALYRAVVRPEGEGSPKWQLALQLTMLFPKANTGP